MIREFCDRCRQEVTGDKSGAINGVADADSQGNGTVTDGFDIVCKKCYTAWKAFMKGKPRSK